MSKVGLLVLVPLIWGASAKSHAQESTSYHGGLENRVPRQPSAAGAAPHHFWDRENTLLFAGVGVGRVLDYTSTCHFRRQGNDEWLLTNSIVDNHPLFMGIELAGAGASIGVSYLFHRTRHHRAERWLSLVHLGVATAGSVSNYTLKPPTVKMNPR